MRQIPILVCLWGLAACGDDQPTILIKFGDFETRRTGDVHVAGQPTREDLARMRDAGIRTVISTRPEGELDWDEKAAVEKLGMTWVSIPFQGAAFGVQELDALEGALASAQGPYLLHCSSGNRVSGLWALHLVRQGETVDEALESARGLGLTKEPAAQRVRDLAEEVRK